MWLFMYQDVFTQHKTGKPEEASTSSHFSKYEPSLPKSITLLCLATDNGK